MGNFDWVLIVLYLALVAVGWVNIYSASYNADMAMQFTMDNLFVKQLIWIGLGLVLIIFILFLDAKFFERFSSIIYIIIFILLQND